MFVVSGLVSKVYILPSQPIMLCSSVVIILSSEQALSDCLSTTRFYQTHKIQLYQAHSSTVVSQAWAPKFCVVGEHRSTTIPMKFCQDTINYAKVITKNVHWGTKSKISNPLPGLCHLSLAGPLRVWPPTHPPFSPFLSLVQQSIICIISAHNYA